MAWCPPSRGFGALSWRMITHVITQISLSQKSSTWSETTAFRFDLLLQLCTSGVVSMFLYPTFVPAWCPGGKMSDPFSEHSKHCFFLNAITLICCLIPNNYPRNSVAWATYKIHHDARDCRCIYTICEHLHKETVPSPGSITSNWWPSTVDSIFARLPQATARWTWGEANKHLSGGPCDVTILERGKYCCVVSNVLRDTMQFFLSKTTCSKHAKTASSSTTMSMWGALTTFGRQLSWIMIEVANQQFAQWFLIPTYYYFTIIIYHDILEF